MEKIKTVIGITAAVSVLGMCFFLGLWRIPVFLAIIWVQEEPEFFTLLGFAVLIFVPPAFFMRRYLKERRARKAQKEAEANLKADSKEETSTWQNNDGFASDEKTIDKKNNHNGCLAWLFLFTLFSLVLLFFEAINKRMSYRFSRPFHIFGARNKRVGYSFFQPFHIMFFRRSQTRKK